MVLTYHEMRWLSKYFVHAHFIAVSAAAGLPGLASDMPGRKEWRWGQVVPSDHSATESADLPAWSGSVHRLQAQRNVFQQATGVSSVDRGKTESDFTGSTLLR
jgi:hypothetical protein